MRFHTGNTVTYVYVHKLKLALPAQSPPFFFRPAEISFSRNLAVFKPSVHQSEMSLRLSAVCLVLPSALGFAPAMLPRGRSSSVPTSHAPSRLSLPLMSADDQWDLERLRSSITSSNHARFGSAEALLSKSNDAWVLLFNPGHIDEGVYTLQCKSDPKTYMVAFECNE